MVGLRSVLEVLGERQPQHLALPLTPVSAPGSVMELAWPLLAVLVVLAVLILCIKKLGWHRVMPTVGVVWVVLWLAGSGALVQRHLNQQTLTPMGPVVAQNLAGQAKRPNLHNTGGTQLFLKVPGYDVPYTVLIDDPQVAQLKPGASLTLNLAQGRFSGLFVTGWQTLAVAPAASL
jgi:hypothetical protein